MVKAALCELIDPGFRGSPEIQQLDFDEMSQVWRITFDDKTTGEVRISPVERVAHKDIKEKVTELAELVRNGENKFPYSTNNLGAALHSLRPRKPLTPA